MKKDESFESLKLRMAGLCASTEYCEDEIRKRLARTSLSNRESDEIIRFLRENRFIDDYRYAAAFARDKVRFAGWGKVKIRAALALKHIPADALSHGLDAIEDSDYIEACRRAGEAKARHLNLNERNDAAKFIRHLQSRGFESGLIFQLLTALRQRD